MNKNTFLVVGPGHSGTQFLANQLNKSEHWTIVHEHDKHALPSLVNERFKPFYGEVNSYLLFTAQAVQARIKAVIYREPVHVLRSILADSFMAKCPTAANDYVRDAMAVVTYYIDIGFVPIDFHRVTTSKKYLVEIANKLGITDLKEGQIDLTPVNRHVEKHVNVITDKHAMKEFAIFRERFLT